MRNSPQNWMSFFSGVSPTSPYRRHSRSEVHTFFQEKDVQWKYRLRARREVMTGVLGVDETMQETCVIY